MSVPPAIRRLPEVLVNRIAAGEVIERPANVVKELVENALDAGARRIEIEVVDGGRERILVRDDGHGIERDDLPLALERHCTSKLASFEALADLDSLGFRGEALASIGSVADLKVTTRTAAARTAFEARIERGEVSIAPAAHPVGTTVVVEHLFADVPARLSFLKGAGIELAHIQSMVRQLAFAAPATAFRLVHGGRQLLSVPAGEAGAPARIAALFGGRFADVSLTVDADGPIRVRGRVAPSEAAHNQRDLQILAVNGRAVRDRHLHHAVRTAYGDDIAAGQFPAYALAVDLERSAVDVNVHPAKLEVRFAALRDVHDAVYAAVRGVLPDVASGSYPSHRSTAPATLRAPAGGGGWASARTSTLVAGEYHVQPSADRVTIQHVPAVIEREVARALAGNARPASRPLLVPVIVDAEASPESAAFEALGFELERQDGATTRITGIPRAVPPVDPDAFVALALGGPATAACVARAAACAWSGELTAVLERWLEDGRDGAFALDGPAIARLLSPS